MAKTKAKGKTKPRKETIDKHIAILKNVASKNGGALPSFTQLEKDGFFGSYHAVQTHAPGVLAKMKREFARDGKAKKTKAKAKKARARKPAKPKVAPVETSVEA